MTSPTITPLGGTTLARKWKLDVDTSTTGPASWVRVMGIGEFKPNVDPTVQDDSDYDSDGWKSGQVTAQQWSLEFKVMRKPKASDATAYDAGQEKVRLANDQIGVGNRVHVRWYEDNGADADSAGDSVGPSAEAYEGYATVSWTPDGGGMDALDTVSVTLTGQGKRDRITHPLYGA